MKNRKKKEEQQFDNHREKSLVVEQLKHCLLYHFTENVRLYPMFSLLSPIVGFASEIREQLRNLFKLYVAHHQISIRSNIYMAALLTDPQSSE